MRKPEWLKISIGANERYTETKRIVENHCLHTICSSGRCPNMGECWGKGTGSKHLTQTCEGLKAYDTELAENRDKKSYRGKEIDM